MVLPLRFAGVLGLVCLLPSLTHAFGVLAHALTAVNWSPERSGGYFHVVFSNIPLAIAAEGSEEVAYLLLSFVGAAVCLALLSRGRMFWFILRRFRL